MTSHRSQFPGTNLKERIAALEQRNAESAVSVQRATSPTPSITSNSSHAGPSNGALRDRIARFEKKGGVPVPRGRFGLGAPPSLEGPRKRGELYGNRIPLPTRALSGGLPPSRPGSIAASSDQRRSFSTSSVISDFDDDHLDYSPMSSPTLTMPPDSPDSATSVSVTPDISPSLGDFSNFKQHIARGTSFTRALEVARKAELEKRGRQNSTTLASRSPPLPEDDGHIESPIETAPTIVVSSEDVSQVIIPETPTVNVASVPSTTPSDSLPLENVLNKELSNESPSETAIVNDASPVITATTHDPLVEKEVARVGTPPLIIRKRTPANLVTPSVVENALKDPDVDVVPIEPQALVSPSPQAITAHDVSAWISDSHKTGTMDFLPEPQPELLEADRQVPGENIELKLSVPEMSPILSLPDIVILNEQSEENVQEQNDAVDDPSINSNAGVEKVAVTLDSGKLNDGPLISPPLQSDHVPDQATTAPPGSLDSSSTPLAAKAITSPDSFLSPPGTGLQFGSPSSGGSSLSSLGSRPMSMIETSPKFITQMLRMTPATGRGVPMFLPPNHGLPRKSDFVYFPPTPEDEATDLGSLTMQNSSHSTRTRSGSDPEDTRSMPSKQTFSAVVHRKVREPASATAPDSKLRPSPQTPQPQRVKRATILETPLSPGHGELAALLQEAVMLENTLNKGELPSENPQLEEETQQMEKKAEAAAVQLKVKVKAEVEEPSRLALATAQLQSKRDEPTTGRLKHTFLVPLSKARSQHRKEAYTAKAEAFLSKSEEPSPPPIPKAANLPSQSTANTASAILPKMSAQQPTVDNDSGSTFTSQLPTKLPRFPSLRKFGSVSRATTGDGASARTNHSTSSEISSEEYSTAVSPENSLEFGQMAGSTLSFPSVSPKKTSTTIARATSFAGKLWSRGRTRSGGSTLSSTSEVNDRVVDDSSVKTPVSRNTTTASPLSLDLPTLPHHPVVPPLSFDEPGHIIPLRRSTSSKRSAVYFAPGLDVTAVPQLPPIVSGFQITPKTSSSSLLPVFDESTRPSTANSVSSIGSLPSPLFNREIVDAFPSVPATTPATTISHRFPHREMGFATPTNASFDTALLSSAIHLSSTTRKMSTPKASFKPLPSENIAVPTSSSGETVR